MKPQLDRNGSHLAYLEPPHIHDPSSVSTIASLPSATLETLPAAVQSALYHLQVSTSIVYASYVRLQELLEERFDWLEPSTDEHGEVTFSEISFFNYVNYLSAEQTYLVSDAHPDWRHKASPAWVAIQPHRDVPVHCNANEAALLEGTILSWWDCLQTAVESWCDYAKSVHIPDYEDTVGEFLATYKQTPVLVADIDETPLETPLAMPTPTLEQDLPSLEMCGLMDKDFKSLDLPQKEDSESKHATLDLVDTYELNSITRTVAQDYTIADIGKSHEGRKDSGVGMIDRLEITSHVR